MLIRMPEPWDFELLAEMRWLLKAGASSTGDHHAQMDFNHEYCEQLRVSEALGDTVHCVVEDTQRLVGALTIRVVRKELSPGKEPGAWGYVTNMYVRSDYRNNGLGRELLGFAIIGTIRKRLELLIVWSPDRLAD